MHNSNRSTYKLLQKSFLIAVLSLSAELLNAQVFPIDTIMENGRRSNRVNFVYMSEGYQSTELETFIGKANNINTGLFVQSPFKEYQHFFNSFARPSRSFHPQKNAWKSGHFGNYLRKEERKNKVGSCEGDPPSDGMYF